MYDLQWDDAAPAVAAPFHFAAEAAEAASLEQRTATVEKVPQGMEVEALGVDSAWGGYASLIDVYRPLWMFIDVCRLL